MKRALLFLLLSWLSGCQTAEQAANDEDPLWAVIAGITMMVLLYVAGFVTLYRKS